MRGSFRASQAECQLFANPDDGAGSIGRRNCDAADPPQRRGLDAHRESSDTDHEVVEGPGRLENSTPNPIKMTGSESVRSASMARSPSGRTGLVCWSRRSWCPMATTTPAPKAKSAANDPAAMDQSPEPLKIRTRTMLPDMFATKTLVTGKKRCASTNPATPASDQAWASGPEG